MAYLLVINCHIREDLMHVQVCACNYTSSITADKTFIYVMTSEKIIICYYTKKQKILLLISFLPPKAPAIVKIMILVLLKTRGLEFLSASFANYDWLSLFGSEFY